MNNTALAGRGLLQSPQEWKARNDILAATIGELITQHVQVKHFDALI